MAFTGERLAVRKLALVAVTLAALISPAHASTAHTGAARAAFVPSVPVATDSNPGAVAAGDFNGDGKADLAVAVDRNGGGVDLFLGNGDGSFRPATFYATGSYPAFLATGDVNGDGKADLVVGDSKAGTVRLFLGTGNGTLAGSASIGGLTFPRAVAVGDLNRDGKQDMVVAFGGAAASFVAILLGQGDGTFAKGRLYAVPSSGDAAPCCVALGDVNRDGKLDLVVTTGADHTLHNGATTSIFPGNGDETFGASWNVDAGPNVAALLLDDLNGNGGPDLITGNGNVKEQNGGVDVLLNVGAAAFGQSRAYLSGQDVTSVVAARFTGGRYDDLAVGNSAGTVTLLRNDGNAVFTADSSFSVGDAVSALVAADFNGDGSPDLAVVGGHNGKVVVYLNEHGLGGGLALPSATPLALPSATLPPLALPSATPLALPSATLPPLALPSATLPPLALPSATLPPVVVPTNPAATSTATRLAATSTSTAVPVTSRSTATATLPPVAAPAATLPRPTSTPSSRRAPTLTPTSMLRSGGGPSPGPATTPPPSAGTASAASRATPTPSARAYPPPSTLSAGSSGPPAANDGRAPSIALNPSTARLGVSVTVHGRDFGAAQLITLALDGEALTTRPAVIVSDRQGSFAATFVAPRNLLAGQNTIAASAAPGGQNTVAPLMGVRGVASQFYFAAGEDSATVHAFLTLLNSDNRPARVRLTFYGRTGVAITRGMTVGATRERTLSVADLHVGSGPFGLAVRADRAIAATLTLSRVGRDGDILLGSPDLATHWYLAEGYTSLTFHESVAILNPGAVPAHVTLHLLPVDGRGARSIRLRVAAHSEAIADVNRFLPHRSLSVSTDSDQPVVVARTVTFSSDRVGPGFGLTLRTGSTTPATSWFFAEGSTLDRFQTFLTVLNPGRARARVTAQFYGSSGRALDRRTLIVAAQSRGTLKLNTFLKASGIASVVTSDRPVLIERAEYFGAPNSPYIAGSDVFGRNGPAARWSFPGGPGTGMNEFLLLYNPSTAPVPIEATFYARNGETRRFRFTMPPHVRDTIVVRRVLANFAPERGVTLRATNGHGFVAEQTLFTPDHRTLLSTQGFAQ